MKRISALLLVCTGLAQAQGRPIDWTSYGADAQRTGWEKSDSRITRENVKDFQLVLKKKLDNRAGGQYSITPPVVIGNLISYRGFKELAFVAGSSDTVWSIDADLDRIFWEKRLKSVSNPAPCRGVAVPALTPPTPRGRGATGRPAPPSSRLGTTAFGAPRPLFVLSADGKLHLLNTSNADEYGSPLDFIPPNAKASNLTLSDGVIYTTTSSGCGGAPSGVWALDLYDDDPKPVSFVPKGGNIGGVAIGLDGTVYLQTESLVALSPRDLKLKQSFAGATLAPVTPVVFSWKGKEMIVCAGKNGSLYLLDAAALETPLHETKPLSSGSFWGGLSSWEDADGTRWVLAPVWGTPNGSIVAFKVEEQNGKPELKQAWASRDMNSPETPVITSGVVFALASGGHAVLYALDGATGKEMYSTGNQVTSPANLTGLTVANGRVYFTTTDNTLYAFGVFLER